MKKYKYSKLFFFIILIFSLSSSIAFSFPKPDFSNTDSRIIDIMKESSSAKNDKYSKGVVSQADKELNKRPQTIKELNKALAEIRIAKANGDKQEKINELEDKINNSLSKIRDIVLQEYTFHGIYQKFKSYLTPIAHNLKEVALYILKILTVLEIVMLLVERPTEFPLSKVGATLIRWAILTFCITKWEYFYSVLKFDAIAIAMKAAGKTVTQIDPDGVFLAYGNPIINSYTDLFKIGEILFSSALLWAFLLLPALFLVGFITIDLIMAELEYMLILGFSVILLPFMIWNKTAGIGSGIFRIFATLLTKLIVMYFFVSIGFELLPRLNEISLYKLESIEFLFKYTIILFIIRTFVGRSQSIASMLVGGGGGSITGREVGGMITGGIARTIGTLAAGLGLLALGKSAAGAAGNAATKSAGKLANTVKRATNMNLKKEENED
ncbi:MAG: type IV secretion system protein [Fusobacterium sp.]|nr:type IV secretion system protein [Fusobacterium sp.]